MIKLFLVKETLLLKKLSGNQKSCSIGVRLIFILIVLFTGKSLEAQHFSFIEIENSSNLTTKNFRKPQINFYASQFNQEKNFGFYYFSLLNENWGQAYAGIQFKPVKWLMLSLGAGLENNANPYRFNISLLILKNNFSWMQIYEYGGSGFWYNILLNYRISDQNSLGLIAKRFYGLGLNFEHIIKKTPISLICSPTYDIDDKSVKFTLTIKSNLSF